LREESGFTGEIELAVNNETKGPRDRSLGHTRGNGGGLRGETQTSLKGYE